MKYEIIMLYYFFTLWRFPRRKDRRQSWVSSLNRVNFVPSNNAKLCSEHFEASCFKQDTKNVILKSDAIPSIFDHSKVQDTSLKYAKCTKASNIESNSEECEAGDSKELGANSYQREFVSYVNCQSGSNVNQSDTNSNINIQLEIILEHTFEAEI